MTDALKPTHYHAHPNGSYAVCDCKPSESAPASPPLPSLSESVVKRFIGNVAELDYFSPDDKPDVMMATEKELRQCLAAALEENPVAPLPPAPSRIHVHENVGEEFCRACCDDRREQEARKWLESQNIEDVEEFAFGDRYCSDRFSRIVRLLAEYKQAAPSASPLPPTSRTPPHNFQPAKRLTKTCGYEHEGRMCAFSPDAAIHHFTDNKLPAEWESESRVAAPAPLPSLEEMARDFLRRPIRGSADEADDCGVGEVSKRGRDAPNRDSCGRFDWDWRARQRDCNAGRVRRGSEEIVIPSAQLYFRRVAVGESAAIRRNAPRGSRLEAMSSRAKGRSKSAPVEQTLMDTGESAISDFYNSDMEEQTTFRIERLYDNRVYRYEVYAPTGFHFDTGEHSRMAFDKKDALRETREPVFECDEDCNCKEAA